MAQIFTITLHSYLHICIMKHSIQKQKRLNLSKLSHTSSSSTTCTIKRKEHKKYLLPFVMLSQTWNFSLITNDLNDPESHSGKIL